MFCNRKGEDDIMTRLKNGNKQESRAAPKWKRWLPMGIAFLLIIAFCGILFYNVALAAKTTYNPGGYCYIKVGDANLPVYVKYQKQNLQNQVIIKPSLLANQDLLK